MRDEIFMKGWLDLAQEVVRASVCDYRIALKRLTVEPYNRWALDEVKRQEEFLLNGWFHDLLDLEGSRLIRTIREEYLK